MGIHITNGILNANHKLVCVVDIQHLHSAIIRIQEVNIGIWLIYRNTRLEVKGGDKMQREIRTLWWCGQGLLVLLVSAFYGYVTIGSILLIPHALMAVFSQFIQEEE